MAALLLLGTPIGAPLGAVAPEPTATLLIQITHLRSQKGVIQVCLTRDPKDFPDCRAATGAIKRTISATTPNLRVESLAQGTWAVAVIHDENSNAKLDTFAGIPREGFGFSRNPKIGFGPPRFTAAQFDVGEGGGTQAVRVRYLL